VHARVAVYRITSGSAEEIARTADDDEGGMLGIFRRQSGFESYELVGAGDTLISISKWETEQQADAAAMAARSWVAEHLARAVELQQNYVGELVLSSSTPGVVGP
jgi:heme-degrading monooxygenase HmoA